jgi:transposase InsO family protein
LLAARSWLAPRPAHAHRAGANGLGAGYNTAAAGLGLIIHADRGSHYTNLVYRKRIEKAQALASYSQPGNPYDNALAEAGWSTLKTELLPHSGAFFIL